MPDNSPEFLSIETGDGCAAAPECCRLTRRQRAFMAAAEQLFAEQGYERTTLADVVDRAGGSLATLYKLFGSKDGLLEAVVFDRVVAGDAIVTKVAAQELPPSKTLLEIAKKLHERYCAPDNLAVFRMVMAHSLANEQFARRFVEITTRSAQTALCALFERWQKDGMTLAGSPALLSQTYFALLVNDARSAVLSHGLTGRQSDADLAERTDFFLRGAGIAD